VTGALQQDLRGQVSAAVGTIASTAARGSGWAVTARKKLGKYSAQQMLRCVLPSPHQCPGAAGSFQACQAYTSQAVQGRQMKMELSASP